MLSNFATVDEVREGLKGIRVCDAPLPLPGGVSLPLHYAVHDAAGGCIVVEYTEGQLKVYDNPLGVMTNSPPFDWMLINLSNYVNLSATGVPKLDLAGFSIHQAGQGSGMLGLPGDFSPPHRFVRTVALAQASLPVTGPDNGVTLAMTLIDSVDIPGARCGRPRPTATTTMLPCGRWWATPNACVTTFAPTTTKTGLWSMWPAPLRKPRLLPPLPWAYSPRTPM